MMFPALELQLQTWAKRGEPQGLQQGITMKTGKPGRLDQFYTFSECLSMCEHPDHLSVFFSETGHGYFG